MSALDRLATTVAAQVAERILGHIQGSCRFLTVREAADHSGVSQGGIRRLLARGQLTAYRLFPRRILISRPELDRLISESAHPQGGATDAR